MTVATVAPDLRTCCSRCGGPFLETPSLFSATVGDNQRPLFCLCSECLDRLGSWLDLPRQSALEALRPAGRSRPEPR
jgi:hypothetical protein